MLAKGKKKKEKTCMGMSMSPPSGSLQKLFGARGVGHGAGDGVKQEDEDKEEEGVAEIRE